MLVQNFIKDIIEEKSDFILDDPWRLNEQSLSVIVPIVRNTTEEREYITYAEANQSVAEDTGQIDYVFVKNNEDKSLLISRGEIFRGKTQERAAVHGYVIMPGKGVRVAVRCIHQSKGIQSGTKMSYGGKVPNQVYNSLHNQGETWNSVIAYSRTIGGNSSVHSSSGSPQWFDMCGGLDNSIYASLDGQDGQDGTGVVDNNFSMPRNDDMVGTLDNMSDMIKEMLKKIPPIENQVGAFFLEENDVKGCDTYEHPDSWKAVKDDVVAKEGASYIKKEDSNIFEFKPEKVKELIRKKLDIEWEEKIIYGETQKEEFKIIEFTEKSDNKSKLMGEAVEFKGKIIQASFYRS